MPFQVSREWNMVVAEHGVAFRQSREWGEFQQTLGRKVIRWQSKNGALAAQIIEQPFGVPPSLELWRAQYFYIPRGPIVLDKNEEKMRAALQELITFLRRAKAPHPIFLRIEPGFSQEHPLAPLISQAGFLHVTSRVLPQKTLLIDLRQDEDELLAAMHHKTRYNIRLAERHGVEAQERPPEALAPLWPLFEETARRDKFSFHPQSYYQKMLEVLRPQTLERPRAEVRLWVATHDNRVLAAAIVGYFVGTAIYLHGVSSSERRTVMAPYLLHWEMMHEAKLRGFHTYDFGGISTTTWPGVTRFKRGFGGKEISFAGVFDVPFHASWYRIYRMTHRLKNYLTRAIF